MPLELKHKKGERILRGRYEVERILGAGAYGTVYRVLDTELGVPKACKEMHVLDNPDTQTSERQIALEMFRREALNFEKIRHKNIPVAHFDPDKSDKDPWKVCLQCGHAFAGQVCPVHGTALTEITERYYLFMDFIDGQSLEDMIRGKGYPLEEEQVLAWTLQVCDALKTVHGMGLVHRDIKPENIKVDRKSGEAFLVDFGLLKESGEGGYGTIKMTGSRGGGTLGYAPENPAERQQQDARSDIHALGMTMYRLLSGQDPTDPGALAAMGQHTPRHFNSKMSQKLESVILKAIRRDPGMRYGSVEELVRALEAPQTPLPQPQVRPTVAPSALCRECGAQLRPGSQFCPQCGKQSRVAPAAPLLAAAQRVSSWAWVALVCGVLAVVPALRLWAGMAAVTCGIAGWRSSHGVAGGGKWIAGSGVGLGGVLALVALVPIAASLRTRLSAGSPLRLPEKPYLVHNIFRNPNDGAEMIFIPGGLFLMGSNESDDEEPPHWVTLDSYWIYKYEVTVAQYRKFCNATGRNMPEAPSWGWKDDHPIVNVSWNDATAYAKWAGVRLPTEAEWEKAARGTDGRRFPWGNEWDSSKWANSVGQSRSSTEPVGSFPADVSPYGALGMVGNNYQWCADWFDRNYYQGSPSRNPQGPSSGHFRVVRGGSWASSNEAAFRCSIRTGRYPDDGRGDVGFRCAQGL